ncbi:serine/threonine-protein kinase [Aquisphaera giovannonii]|nr:serine/threonine-protein kinase [Aquisphaera giovannonii]
MTTSPESREDGRFDELAEEFAARCRRGERPDVEEYVGRLPGMADRIRRVFPTLLAAGRGDDESRDRATSPPNPPRLREVGDYRIVREVGRGGMGIVYEAEQVSLGRRVALKVLPSHVVGDRRALQRFRREAKAAAGLHHTNIVPVYEVGQKGDVAFYAMQFIQGQGLDQVIRELKRLRHPAGTTGGEAPRGMHRGGAATENGSPAPAHASREGGRVRRAAACLLTGRLAAGGSGTTLRESAADGLATTEPIGPGRSRIDGPPDTIGDAPEGGGVPDATTSAVLPGGPAVPEADASRSRLPYYASVAQIGRQAAQGLAHAHARGVVHRDIKPSNLLLDTAGVVWITDFGLAKAGDDGLTATGDVLGTLRYLAPERFRGGGDARADVYALGLTLYELLTLRPAFSSADRLSLIDLIKAEEPARPRAIDGRIPRDLETIVLKATAKDPERRYQTAGAMAEDLRRYLADEPILARRANAAERYWRWARRNPAVAILGAVLTGVLVVATAGSLVAARRFRAQAETERRLAQEESGARRKADEANARLNAEEERLRRTVYATRSNLALAAWDNADVRRLRSLIDQLRPGPGEPDPRGWEWRYLWQLDHEDRLTLRGREDDFADVAFSPDGQSFASLESRGRIQIRDLRSGELKRTMGITTGGRPASLAGGVGAIAFRPDGRAIAGPGPDDSLVLYDVETGRPVLRFEGSPRTVLGLAWSPDGRTLVAAITAHVMRVWDARDGRRLHEAFGGHGGPVACVAFSPDGRTLASASFDNTVKLWGLDDRSRPRAVLNGHTDEVRAVAFSPDGRWIASASRDRTLRIWDARSGAGHAVIRGHAGAVTSVAFLPGNIRVVTGSEDETVRVWDAGSGRGLRTFQGHQEGVVALSVSPDGRAILSLSGESIRAWDPDSPPRPLTLQSPSVLTYGGAAECVAFRGDGRRLASGHDDHALRLWDLRSGGPPRILKGHTMAVRSVAFSPDGRTIASASLDGTARLWDAETGEPRLAFTGHADRLKSLAFADDHTVLSAGFDRNIQAWAPETAAVLYVLRGHSDSINDLAVSDDGRTLASASDDMTCILWDLAERRPRLTLRGHTDRVNRVAFSPDGLTIATASDDHTVRLWDVLHGSPRGVLEGHTDEVLGLAYNPDGRLASSGKDKTILLWDCASGQTLLDLKGHTGPIRCIRFSPDGRTLASASYDRMINLWEAAPAAILAPTPREPTGASPGDPPGRMPGEGPVRSD